MQLSAFARVDEKSVHYFCDEQKLQPEETVMKLSECKNDHVKLKLNKN